MKITDEVFGPLARRLREVDVERTFKRSIAIAADDTREELRRELAAEGASVDIVNAVHVLRDQDYLSATVGVDEISSVAADAVDFEYGSADNSIRPAGVFRYVSGGFAEDAGDHFAASVMSAING